MVREKQYWKSLQERSALEHRDEALLRELQEEFSDAPQEMPGGWSRRGFLRPAGFAVAGTVLTGCNRAPVQKAIPLLVRPEFLTPGRAVYYASACGDCSAGCGILIKNRHGRPIRLEGNRKHPVSRGGLCAVGQASVLGLYDSLRLKDPLIDGKAAAWQDVDTTVMARLRDAAKSDRGICFLSGTNTSPARRALLAIFFLHPSLYPWAHAGAAGGEHLTGFKAAWLSLPFFWARSVFYLALWFLLSRAIVRHSQEQDRDPKPEYTRAKIRYSAMYLLGFGLTFWLASMDWIMSLEPEWSTTMFGVYNFAGLFLGGLAAIALLVIWLRKTTALGDFINEEHLHDLGKLLFAFSTFWMYIWFCQYMLIWYANIPEETSYFILRRHGFWEPISLLNIFLNWIIPFVVLMPAASKRNPSTLAKVAVIVLLGRWVDLYLMIFPPLTGQTPVFGLWEIGSIVGVFGLFLVIFQRALGQATLVRLTDPRLEDSLHYHN